MADSSPAPTRGYTASKEQLLKRLARVESPVRGISRMVEEDRYCVDVLTQINAVRAALDKVALGLLDGHARHCLLGRGGGPRRPRGPGAGAHGRRRPDAQPLTGPRAGCSGTTRPPLRGGAQRYSWRRGRGPGTAPPQVISSSFSRTA